MTWEKTIGLADLHGTVVKVECDANDADEDPYTVLQIRTGGATIFAHPSAEAWRRLAAACFDAADDLEGQ